MAMAGGWHACTPLVVVAVVFLVRWEVGPKAVEAALGMNWGTVSYNPLPNSDVVQLLQDNNVVNVKLFDADPNVIKSMQGTSLEVMVGSTNDMLATFASSTEAAAAWVKQNVTAYLGTGGVNIKYAAVGNEPFLTDYNGQYTNSVLPALQNIQAALAAAGLANTVKAVVPCNADILSGAALPSQNVFRSDLSTIMVQMVAALNSTGSPFIVNLYPFLSLVLGTNFPITFAFFSGSTSQFYDGTLLYTNVFDASYDGLVAALAAAGYPNMNIVVGEIGWPTDGTTYANITLAQRFNQQLVNHMLSGNGTPKRPGIQLEGYLFSLLDEDEKSTLPGPFERHWGVFNYDGSVKYPLDLTGGVNGAQTSLVPAKDVPYYPNQWCVINPNADMSTLAANEAYACLHGDCTALETGGSCSGLTVNQNASYAFNNYYQFNDQLASACDFEGLAEITTTDPSVGTCKFLVGLKPSDASASSTPTGMSGGKSGGSSSHGTLRLSSVFIAAIVVSSFVLT